MKIGVARVSTRDQHPEAQEDALRAADCEKVFTDKASGKLARRPELDKALMVAREGDQLGVPVRTLSPAANGGDQSFDLEGRGSSAVLVDSASARRPPFSSGT
ncbi:recombinase family protein [Streptomyces sp. NPDC048275]|uniref:recombinase family protein n=1 Tax=Streptomyces sp. NPDC048275 TaxID=3155629 RepID=UPI00340433CA